MFSYVISVGTGTIPSAAGGNETRGVVAPTLWKANH
jgi:hypothetical protein